MTVSSTTFFTDWYPADGVNKNWSYDFLIYLAADVIVQVRDGTDDDTIVEFTSGFNFLPDTTDYTGGFIQYPASGPALANTKQVRIVRTIAYTQTTEIGSEGAFNPELHERTFDRLVMMIQQLYNSAARSILAPLGYTGYELAPNIQDGKVLILSNGLIDQGPSADDIAEAQGYAAAAAQSKNDANAAYIAANNARIAAEAAAASITGAPIGSFLSHSGSTAPGNYLKANGAAISRTSYAALFAVIGTTYGAGDGATTFNLPDRRGEFERGLDDGRGVDAGRALGTSQGDQNKAHSHTGTAASGGAHTHTGSTDTTGDHSHTVTVATSGSGGANPQGSTFNGGTSALSGKIGTSGAHSHALTINSDGAHSHSLTINSDGGAEARPRNQASLICIKYL